MAPTDPTSISTNPATTTDTAAPAAIPSPTSATTTVVDPAAARAARKKARKQLRAMHAMNRSDPTFDHKTFHALHYLAAGKPVPDTDPDDLD